MSFFCHLCLGGVALLSEPASQHGHPRPSSALPPIALAMHASPARTAGRVALPDFGRDDPTVNPNATIRAALSKKQLFSRKAERIVALSEESTHLDQSRRATRPCAPRT